MPADLPQAAHLAPYLSERDIKRFLVHIHATENLGRLFYGLPPFSGPLLLTLGASAEGLNDGTARRAVNELDRNLYGREVVCCDQNALADIVRQVKRGVRNHASRLAGINK